MTSAIEMLEQRRDVKVWICPFCGSAERYDPPQRGDSPTDTPFCEWCADDPEGGGEVPMELHTALPDVALDAALAALEDAAEHARTLMHLAPETIPDEDESS